MDPKVWRLLISGSLRLFLLAVVPAAAHPTALIALATFVIAFLVPAPAQHHSWANTTRDRPER